MKTLIEHLESFNRKERFFLVGSALGNPRFQLSSKFRWGLDAAFGILTPCDTFVAMDYHLDWIYASLFLLALPEKDHNKIHLNTAYGVLGNQQDIDLLVAFEKEGITNLLLVEAKATPAWTTSDKEQTQAKAKRLSCIFDRYRAKYPRVKPYFGLTSPCRPDIEFHEWPAWMTKDGQPIWFPLTMPPGRRKITRCDSKASAKGKYFRVKSCDRTHRRIER